jgi:aminoglycoside 3-N-acetyltransferase
MRRHHNDQQPLISEDFIKLDRALEECGATRVVPFGDARCILCDAQRTFEVIRHILAPDPECIITSPEILPEQWADFVAEK